MEKFELGLKMYNINTANYLKATCFVSRLILKCTECKTENRIQRIWLFMI